MTRNGKVEEKEMAIQKFPCSNLPHRLSESPWLAAMASQQHAERSIIGANVYAPMYKEEIRVEVKE